MQRNIIEGEKKPEDINENFSLDAIKIDEQVDYFNLLCVNSTKQDNYELLIEWLNKNHAHLANYQLKWILFSYQTLMDYLLKKKPADYQNVEMLVNAMPLFRKVTWIYTGSYEIVWQINLLIDKAFKCGDNETIIWGFLFRLKKHLEDLNLDAEDLNLDSIIEYNERELKTSYGHVVKQPLLNVYKNLLDDMLKRENTSSLTALVKAINKISSGEGDLALAESYLRTNHFYEAFKLYSNIFFSKTHQANIKAKAGFEVANLIYLHNVSLKPNGDLDPDKTEKLLNISEDEKHRLENDINHMQEIAIYAYEYVNNDDIELAKLFRQRLDHILGGSLKLTDQMQQWDIKCLQQFMCYYKTRNEKLLYTSAYLKTVKHLVDENKRLNHHHSFFYQKGNNNDLHVNHPQNARRRSNSIS